MTFLAESPGFLGTGASLLADLTLLAYILLITPATIIGYVMARRGQHRPGHKWLMIIVTAANWALIAFIMLATFRLDVLPNVGAQPTNPRYGLPALHAVFGLPAQLLATYIVVRMLMEDVQVARAKQRGERDLRQYWFKAARWTMQVTLVLWLLTTSLGIVTYLARYNVIRLPGTEIITPAITPEPAATEALIDPPAATEESDG